MHHKELGGKLGGVTAQDPHNLLKDFDNSKIESL